jgi:hypothetical protein
MMRNFLNDWPLYDKSFLKSYGELKVQTGSESSIVYSEGSADGIQKLEDIVQCSSEGVRDATESLSFDLNILKKYPKLLSNYKMPNLLNSIFLNDVNSSSPVLSIGCVGSGMFFCHLL